MSINNKKWSKDTYRIYIKSSPPSIRQNGQHMAPKILSNRSQKEVIVIALKVLFHYISSIHFKLAIVLLTTTQTNFNDL